MKDDPKNYRKVLNELEDEIEHAEEDFEEVKDDSASDGLAEKQERAQKLMKQIHGQIEFLEEQLDRIGEKD